MYLGSKDGVRRDHHVELLDIIAPVEIVAIFAHSPNTGVIDDHANRRWCVLFLGLPRPFGERKALHFGLGIENWNIYFSPSFVNENFQGWCMSRQLLPPLRRQSWRCDNEC